MNKLIYSITAFGFISLLSINTVNAQRGPGSGLSSNLGMAARSVTATSGASNDRLNRIGSTGRARGNGSEMPTYNTRTTTRQPGGTHGWSWQATNVYRTQFARPQGGQHRQWRLYSSRRVFTDNSITGHPVTINTWRLYRYTPPGIQAAEPTSNPVVNFIIGLFGGGKLSGEQPAISDDLSQVQTSVYNLDGKLVLNKAVEGDINNLPQGIYLKVKTADGQVVTAPTKFMVK